MEIDKGPHTIVIIREGYEPWQTEITVQNASNHSIDARLLLDVTTVRVGVGGGGAVGEEGGISTIY